MAPGEGNCYGVGDALHSGLLALHEKHHVLAKEICRSHSPPRQILATRMCGNLLLCSRRAPERGVMRTIESTANFAPACALQESRAKLTVCWLPVLAQSLLTRRFLRSTQRLLKSQTCRCRTETGGHASQRAVRVWMVPQLRQLPKNAVSNY